MTKILGKSVATAEQMSTYLLLHNKNPLFSRNISTKDFCQLFIDICAKEGVRGDIAFAQAYKETGIFKFKGDVKYTQNNFAGLGATGNGVCGCSFKDIETGILAQAQHLKTYATKLALNETCVDPRRTTWFVNAKSGTSPDVETLGGTWAVPGYDTKKYSSLAQANVAKDSYGYQIINILNDILKINVKEEENIMTNVNSNLEIRQCLLVNNDCYKQHKKMTPSGIVVHSTGANNPNLKRYVQPNDGILGVNPYNNHWNKSGVSKCVHAFIGKDANDIVRVYQTLPWDYCCWGSGSGKNGTYNNKYIQFEICEDALTDANYFNQAFSLAIELCSYLVKKYNISILNIVSHNEAYKRGYATGHVDCDHWLSRHGKNMDWFRNQVSSKSGITTSTATIPSSNNSTVSTTPTVNVTYAVKVEGGKVLPAVNNLDDYAGIENKKIIGLAMKVDKGTIKYQVHEVGGDWLPYVTGYNWNDHNNGYAGNGKPIDAVRVYYNTPSDLVANGGYREAKYRVSPVGSVTYYDWQLDDTVNKAKGMDGYAGAFGKAIDKFQICIE